MDRSDLILIEAAGALAFLAATDAVLNPLYRTRALPVMTAMPVEDWLQRAEAWQRGWKREAEKHRPRGRG